mmetsp:Transcript_9846/g.26883  ORF Transcript_9846/g.26883 Transcript_9846/m.26883 type:complete len:90 (+) Transcript_9846:592-861(+)
MAIRRDLFLCTRNINNATQSHDHSLVLFLFNLPRTFLSCGTTAKPNKVLQSYEHSKYRATVHVRHVPVPRSPFGDDKKGNNITQRTSVK